MLHTAAWLFTETFQRGATGKFRGNFGHGAFHSVHPNQTRRSTTVSHLNRGAPEVHSALISRGHGERHTSDSHAHQRDIRHPHSDMHQDQHLQPRKHRQKLCVAMLAVPRRTKHSVLARKQDRGPLIHVNLLELMLCARSLSTRDGRVRSLAGSRAWRGYGAVPRRTAHIHTCGRKRRLTDVSHVHMLSPAPADSGVLDLNVPSRHRVRLRDPGGIGCGVRHAIIL